MESNFLWSPFSFNEWIFGGNVGGRGAAREPVCGAGRGAERAGLPSPGA